MEMCLRAAKSLIHFTSVVQEVAKSLSKEEGHKNDPEVAWELLRLFVVPSFVLDCYVFMLSSKLGLE